MLKSLIERVEVRHSSHLITATICWKTGMTQSVNIKRSRSKGIRESYWTEQEVETLKIIWPDGDWNKILDALPGRTMKSISHKANKMKLKRVRSNSRRTKGRPWSQNDEDRIRRMYEDGVGLSYIAEQVGRSQPAIRQRALKKGWQRSQTVGGKTRAPYWREVKNPEVCNASSSGKGLRGWGDSNSNGAGRENRINCTRESRWHQFT